MTAANLSLHIKVKTTKRKYLYLLLRCQPNGLPMLQSRTLWWHLEASSSSRRRTGSLSPPCLASPPPPPPTPPLAPCPRRRRWEKTATSTIGLLLTALLLSSGEEPPPSPLLPPPLVHPTSNSHRPQSQEGCQHHRQPGHSRSLTHLALRPPMWFPCLLPTSSSRWAPLPSLTDEGRPAGAAATLVTAAPPLLHISPHGPSHPSPHL